MTARVEGPQGARGASGERVPSVRVPSVRMPSGRILVAALVFEVLTLVAAAAWWPIYQSSAFVLLALVTVTVGVGIGAAGARWSWPSHLVLVATVLAWLLLGVPLAVPAKALWGVLPTPAGLADLVVTTAAGWRQLLTIELPVGDYQALLVPAFVTLLVASVLGVSVAARTSRPAFAVVLPALVLTGGIVFGGSAAFAPIAVGAVFAVLAVAWLVLSRIRVPGRAVAAAAGVVAAGLVVAVGVTVALPAPDRVVARDAVEQPFDARDYPSPLSGFRAFTKEPLADDVVLTVTGAQPGARIVLARMNDYDGVVYNVGGAGDASALFSRVPERLGGGAAGAGAGAGAGAADSGATSTVAVQVGAYDSVWVPSTGDPVAVAFTGPNADALQNSLYFSAALGTVADTVGLRDGDSYTLTTRLPAATAPAVLAELTPGAAPSGPNDAVPDAVAVRLAEWAPASGSPGERLAGVVDGLRAGYVSGSGDGEVFRRSGHGADRIQELLTASPMIGDDEQYAVAGALLAEAAGFPARVAMGFTVPADAAVGGPIDIRGQDAGAWTEVFTAESGWVAFDATPEPRAIPETALDDSSTAVQPPDVVPPAADDLDDPVETAPLQQNDDEPAPADDVLAAALRIAAVVGLSLAGLAIVLAPFLIVLALKSRRRARRRTQGTARARAAGGWAELVDTARDVAEPPPPNATRREAARTLGGDSAVLLAERIDGAVYAPADPAEPEIEEIWAAADAERRRLLESRGWFARLRARVSTRSLRTYHGREEKRRDIR